MTSVYDKYRCHFNMERFKHILKNIICLFLVLSISFSGLNLRAYAIESWPERVYVASEGACLMDADSKTVLFGKDEHSAYYPASITKVLTALVVLENCKNLSEQVVFSYDAVHIEEENSTIIGASEGDRLSVLDCLYSLLFQSANEVANALAEHIGAQHSELKEDGMSDRDVFVKMMNMKAEELGCRGSHFNNPSGLTDSNHYTTAYDMCLIMAAAIENKQFLDIEKHTYWTHAPISRYPNADDPWNTVYPKHLMLKRNSSQYYKGAIAGKTGYTMNAGNTLVTAAKRDGMTLVTCVLNAHANHYNDTIRLMNFGFDNFSSIRVNDYEDINSIIKRDFSIGGTTLIDAYTVGIDPDTRVTIPKSASYVEVGRKLDVQQTEKGTNAVMSFSYGDRTVGSAQIKLMSIGGMAEYESEAEKDPLLADILGMSKAKTAEGTDDNNTDVSGAAGDALSKADGDSEGADSEGGKNDNAAASGGTTETLDQGDDNTVSEAEPDDAANLIEDSGLSEAPSISEPAQARAHKRAADISNIIGTAAKVLAGAAVLIALIGIARSISNNRRKKRRRRRMSGRKRGENGIIVGEGTAYIKDRRRLRKTKRKRKR